MDSANDTGFHPKLDATATLNVTDYIEHNELELALRTMQEATQEQCVSLPEEASQHLKQAAFLMKVDL